MNEKLKSLVKLVTGEKVVAVVNSPITHAAVLCGAFAYLRVSTHQWPTAGQAAALTAIAFARVDRTVAAIKSAVGLLRAATPPSPPTS